MQAGTCICRRSFSVSSQALASVTSAPGATRQLPLLTRHERQSLSKTDRVRGRLSKRMGGRRIPFSESDWGRKRERRHRIKAKAEAEFIAHEEDVELREQKRQSSLTSQLPELTAGDVEKAYLSLMAPAPSAETSSSRPALPAPTEPARDLLTMRARLAVPRLFSNSIPPVTQDLEQVLSSLEASLAEIEAARSLLSDKAAGKSPSNSGIATEEEWLLLLHEGARSRSPALVIRALTLMQRAGASVDSDVLAGVCDVFALQRDVDGAETFLQAAIDAGFNIDTSVHHAVLSAHVNAGDLVNAQFYLRALERRGLTPLETSYQLIIDALLDRKRPTAAWNLFSHCRAVAHPTPSEPMWASMIAACAPNSLYASAERALDLQQEMYDQGVPFGAKSYAALITVCAKRGGAEQYIKALSLLRDMIDAGHAPSRATLETVLEAAAREGDLARARWIFAQLVAASEAGDWSMAPTSNALTSVLLAHAKCPIETPKLKAAEKPSDASAEARETDEMDEEQELLRFPGPMPRTRGEVMSSAENLFLKYAASLGVQGSPHRVSQEEADAFVAEHGEEGRLPTTRGPDVEIGFGGMQPDTRTLDAFLLVMRDVPAARKSESHLTLLYSVYRTLYARFGLSKPESAVALMLQACLQHRTHDKAAEYGSSIFAAYVKSLGGNVLKLKPGDGTEPLAPYSAFTSRIWSHIICLLACADQHEPTLKLASQFAVLYPPSLITHFARAVATSEERVPEAEISIASPDYAETSTFHAGPLRPPRLEFEHVKTLHQKLKMRGAEEGARWLSSLLRQYTVASQYAERIIRGNDALPHGDRGPWDRIGKTLPLADQPSILVAPAGDESQASRERMLAGLGVQWQQADHAPQWSDPLRRLDGVQVSQQRKVPPPPSRTSVVAALEAQRASL